MRQGRRLAPAEDLEALRERAREQLANLPPALRELNSPADYPVRDTAGLRRLAKELDEPGR